METDADHFAFLEGRFAGAARIIAKPPVASERLPAYRRGYEEGLRLAKQEREERELRKQKLSDKGLDPLLWVRVFVD